MSKIMVFRAGLFILFNLHIGSLMSQDVLMQGWYWDYPKTVDGHSWVDTLDDRVNDLADQGITQLWLPPLSRASFGNGSNGYDPQDLFDLGEFGGGATGFGTRAQLDALISKANTAGVDVIADVVYNHRDGGDPEANPAVEGWIENYNCTKKNAGDNPFPSDRFRLGLPLGGASGNGAGTYFIKVASVSGHSDFYNSNYRFYCETNTVGFSGLPDLTESEPNGGGGCGGNNTVSLGQGILAWTDNWNTECVDIGCNWEEFQLTLNVGDFNSAGDTLWINLNNIGGYSDHTVRELYSTGKVGNIANELIYFTFTDFTNMPSGRGGMNYPNFKPNGNPTNLNGDWDAMLFFYDYDQNVQATEDTLTAWTKWLIQDVGINGLRMDAVKHFDPAFLSRMFNTLETDGVLPDYVVGELFDFDANTLKGWVDNVENGMSSAAAASITTRVFDFALRDALEKASDQFGYDVRNVFNSGVVNGAGGSSDQVVTFVNNHDFREGDKHVDNDPELAYAYILLNPNIGDPCIFYPDYYGTDLPAGPDEDLGSEINLLLDIKNKVIDGASSVDYLSAFGSTTPITYNQGMANTSLIFQVQNASKNQEAIVAINYSGDTLDVAFNWNKLPNSNGTLTDRTGKGLKAIVVPDNTGNIRLLIPPRSYAVWTTEDVPSDCNYGSIIYVDAMSTGDNDGSSWANAFTNLASAINVAYNCSDVSEVWVKEGTYYPNAIGDRSLGFVLQDGYTLIGGFPQGVANPTMSDRTWDITPSILSGDIGMQSDISDNTYHVLISPTTSDTIRIDGFFVENGNANGTMSLSQGGGLFNLTDISLKNVLFRNNKAINGGSDIMNLGFLRLEGVTLNGENSTSSSLLNSESSEVEVMTLNRIK